MTGKTVFNIVLMMMMISTLVYIEVEIVTKSDLNDFETEVNLKLKEIESKVNNNNAIIHKKLVEGNVRVIGVVTP
jgi:hypothetical protein